MPRDTTRLASSSIGFRVRRAHAKSRNGCSRCKQQRKKCDELRPRCSRCANRMYECQYQGSPDDTISSDEHEAPDKSHSDLDLQRSSPQISTRASDKPIAYADDYLSVHGSLHSTASQTPPFGYPEDTRSGAAGPVASLGSSHLLNATELSLLSHYLTHASLTIPCDKIDLYALSIGMPNLAFSSRPVMSSLIALAAACKSHDLVVKKKSPLDSQILAEIRDLLVLADCHHRSSLQHIQAYFSQSDCYDSVLANAALMVLYASASHSTRVRLAINAKRNSQQLPSELLPQNSQWISFTRAAHMASSAVLKNMTDATNHIRTPATSLSTSSTGFPSDALNDTRVLVPEDGPSEKTKSLFLPIVASTHIRAFEGLRKRAISIASRFKAPNASAHENVKVNACLGALPLLEHCAAAALSRKESGDDLENPGNEPDMFDDSCGVSSWIANYMIRVTSMKLPKVLRRTIMSYLNKAPAEFLNIIQSVLDLSVVKAGPESRSPRDTNTASLTTIQLLALDIFSHWLVLLMLLDGVWWIGRIGQWELGQIVSLINTQELLPQLADTEDTWWPQSMYLINLELTNGS